MTEPKSSPSPAADNEATRRNSGGNGAAEDATNEAAAVLEDLEALKTRAQQRDEYLDLLQRTRADFANYQKRNQKEREQERRYWDGPLILDLLPVIDNLERTLAAAKQTGESGPLVKGVGVVLADLYLILRRHGVMRIEAEGVAFDPNLHEAVMQQSSKEPPGTVLKVLEHGFMLHDRVLRPSKVIVSTS